MCLNRALRNRIAGEYGQLFNTLNDGDLATQDSWTASDGTPAQNVQTSVRYEGAKAVSCIMSGANQESDYRRTISSTAASQYFCFQVTSTSAETGFAGFAQNGVANYVALMYYPGPVSVDKVLMNATTVVTGLSANTWYPVNVEWDVIGQTNKVRARVYQNGAWSSYTAWTTTSAFTVIDTIRMDCSSGDGGAAHTTYYDTFSATDPVVVPSVAVTPLPPKNISGGVTIGGGMNL